jgi:hypothetical protein
MLGRPDLTYLDLRCVALRCLIADGLVWEGIDGSASAVLCREWGAVLDALDADDVDLALI